MSSRPTRTSRKCATLAALAVALCLGQTPSQLISPEVRRVGSKLACLCGTCKNSVGDCPMLHCHYSSPAREKIASLLEAGKTDGQIVDAMVAEKGRQALVVPPVEGFHLLAWTMPYVAVGLGLLVIVWFVRRVRRPVAVPLPEVDPAVLERIEKDLAKLDG